jgi:hypothetical protein
MWVNFTIMNWLQKPAAEISTVNQVMWLQTLFYSHLLGQSLSNFFPKAPDDFEVVISCSRHLSDFCGVFSNSAPVLSSFSWVST